MEIPVSSKKYKQSGFDLLIKLPILSLPKPAAYAILAMGMLLITLAWLAFTQSLPWYTETDWTPIRQGIMGISRDFCLLLLF